MALFLTSFDLYSSRTRAPAVPPLCPRALCHACAVHRSNFVWFPKFLLVFLPLYPIHRRAWYMREIHAREVKEGKPPSGTAVPCFAGHSWAIPTLEPKTLGDLRQCVEPVSVDESWGCPCNGLTEVLTSGIHLFKHSDMGDDVNNNADGVVAVEARARP